METKKNTPMTATPEWMTFMTAHFEAINKGYIEGREKYNEHINIAMNKLKKNK